MNHFFYLIKLQIHVYFHLNCPGILRSTRTGQALTCEVKPSEKIWRELLRYNIPATDIGLHCSQVSKLLSSVMDVKSEGLGSVTSVTT